MTELRKSKRFDYAQQEPAMTAYRYDGGDTAAIKLIDKRGSVETEKLWSRDEVLAARNLLTAMLEDWPL